MNATDDRSSFEGQIALSRWIPCEVVLFTDNYRFMDLERTLLKVGRVLGRLDILKRPSHSRWIWARDL